jgi:hypothetical protein
VSGRERSRSRVAIARSSPLGSRASKARRPREVATSWVLRLEISPCGPAGLGGSRTRDVNAPWSDARVGLSWFIVSLVLVSEPFASISWIQLVITRMSRLSTGVVPIGPDRWFRTWFRYRTRWPGATEASIEMCSKNNVPDERGSALRGRHHPLRTAQVAAVGLDDGCHPLGLDPDAYVNEVCLRVARSRNGTANLTDPSV